MIELTKNIEDLVPYVKLAIRARIATFGLYAGYVDEKGAYKKMNNSARMILEALPPKSSIILGIPELWPCKEGCMDCANKHIKLLQRVEETIKEFPLIEFTKTNQWHAKWYLLEIDGIIQGWTGGHNLTGSGWDDITVKMSNYSTVVAWGLHQERVQMEYDARIGNLEDWCVQEDR